MKRHLQSVGIGSTLGRARASTTAADAYLGSLTARYLRSLAGLGKGLEGLSKISVQTGTSHGGVVLPDGSIAVQTQATPATVRQIFRMVSQSAIRARGPAGSLPGLKSSSSGKGRGSSFSSTAMGRSW